MLSFGPCRAVSGEAPFDPIWVQADVESMVNAQAFGAVVAAVEHRFYGGSQPFGDLSTDHLRYLSSQQALADLAATITALQAKYKPTATVVFGGSYSGALAGWFRTKYPHLADVGVATSSPVLAELDFIEYLEVVTASLGDSLVGGSAACTKAITDATSTIQQMATTDDGLAQLSSKFNTCEKLSTASSAQDIQNFFSTIIGSFSACSRRPAARTCALTPPRLPPQWASCSTTSTTAPSSTREPSSTP